ncbi:hypothetical protein [Massilia sp. DWR3-1-1]|uniref:hypothetical protein n=1 Tax=Massilia sp. DWR3-1-1 TaxID=2804559 RepID=UPI003CE7177C
MKDQLALLIAGMACSLLAWTFWHYLGADAVHVLGIVFILTLALDNRRLRARLRQQARAIDASPGR